MLNNFSRFYSFPVFVKSIPISNIICCITKSHTTPLRRYPNIFHESYSPDSAGTPVPWFHLTPEALEIHCEELDFLEENQTDIQNRLRKLLMFAGDGILPMEIIDRLKWDLGLPHDYVETIILNHPDLFSLVRHPNNTAGLKLLVWGDSLAVSALEKNTAAQQKQDDIERGILSFPIRFTRGFGLKKKWMRWLEEWQRLPYTSPHSDTSHLDPRTDESEKRIVGVFHELLHLTLKNKTERNNVRGLREPFARVFERHPGIFYVSRKTGAETVILREAYDWQSLLYRHPIVDVREKLANMLREGFLNRSKGLYRKEGGANLVEVPGDGIYRVLKKTPMICSYLNMIWMKISKHYERTKAFLTGKRIIHYS